MNEHILCMHKVKDGYFALSLDEVIDALNLVDWHCKQRKGLFAIKDVDYVNEVLQIVLYTEEYLPKSSSYKAFMIPAIDCFAGRGPDEDKVIANNTLQILSEITIDKVNKRVP